jgi:type II secretory pathway pseudopilin PulG
MRRKQGISLIVLVITIIVMIILAASVIISLSNSGIINKANDAVDKTNASEVQNLATLAWAEEFMDGKRGDSLKEAVLDALKDYTDKYDVEVSDTGVSVNKKGEGAVVGIDWDAILADANANPNKYKHPDQTESEDIGIGTDGKPVNMDYWNWLKDSILTDNKLALVTSISSNNIPGYIGDYTADGQIIGKVPQYIKPANESEFLTVESMYATFNYCYELKIAPEIPDTVVDMERTFYGCGNLTTASKIPASVVNMNSTFMH